MRVPIQFIWIALVQKRVGDWGEESFGLRSYSSIEDKLDAYVNWSEYFEYIEPIVQFEFSHSLALCVLSVFLEKISSCYIQEVMSDLHSGESSFMFYLEEFEFLTSMWSIEISITGWK